MLLRFSVSNFLSFHAEQEFNMLPGRIQKPASRVISDGTSNVLKFCALYGANASGKSNLIKAVHTAQNIIIHGAEKLSKDLYHKPRPANKDEVSKFEFEIKVKDQYYAYGFSIILDKGKIISEWLFKLGPSGEQQVFFRDMVNNTVDRKIRLSKQSADKMRVYSEDILNMENVLFLSEIARKQLKDSEFSFINDVYNWFAEQLVVVYPATVLNIPRFFMGESNEHIIRLLRYFDTGITGLELKISSLNEVRQAVPKTIFERITSDIEEMSKRKHKVKGVLKSDDNIFEVAIVDGEMKVSELLFKHGENDSRFSFGEESDGTRRLMDLLDIINDENKGKVYLVDELDRSFHPQMTRKFVETFLSATDKTDTQLIITTHESNLLDLSLLRRDEIWFVKREDNMSRLYSLDDFKVRFDKVIDTDYLDGRYGAVPVFKDFGYLVGDL